MLKHPLTYCQLSMQTAQLKARSVGTPLLCNEAHIFTFWGADFAGSIGSIMLSILLLGVWLALGKIIG